MMVRAMCDQKIVDKKTTEEQMNMLGLKETTIFEVLHRLVIGQKNNGLLTRCLCFRVSQILLIVSLADFMLVI